MTTDSTLHELTGKICNELREEGYTEKSVRFYRQFYGQLMAMAESRGETQYSEGLGAAFRSSGYYTHAKDRRPDEICHSKMRYRNRCIAFIESFLSTGAVDCGYRCWPSSAGTLVDDYSCARDGFRRHLQDYDLKTSTIKDRVRFAEVFLAYLQDIGRGSFEAVRSGDVSRFISHLREMKYSQQSFSTLLSRLRSFLNYCEALQPFRIEVPERLPQKRSIIETFNTDENEKIRRTLECGDMSSRNRSIGFLLFEVGLRPIDINGLRLDDIDWEKRIIHITQSKTGVPMDIPLRPTYGKPLKDYVFNERAPVESRFVFLTDNAPHTPFSTSTGCYRIFMEIVKKAGVESGERESGPRIARHNAASGLVRAGVPLSDVSSVLGHRDPNSTMVYVSTDSGGMAGCTLPLPETGGRRND